MISKMTSSQRNPCFCNINLYTFSVVFDFSVDELEKEI